MAAPGSWWQRTAQKSHSIPYLAGHMVSKGTAWLLDGLQSVGDLAGLSPAQSGEETQKATVPGM